jgi:flagellar M-ring protein FliF
MGGKFCLPDFINGSKEEKPLVDKAVDFIKTMGAARIAAMGAVGLALVGFFAFIMLRMSQPQMVVMFTDLEFDDSIAIVQKLEGMNIQHELRQDGAVILVPKEQKLRLRMQLAEDGLPAGGSVGYEIFDKSDTFGATSFLQNINHLRALEGELARTIRSLSHVQMARVHLVIPERKLFSRQQASPSASIVLRVRGHLDAGQVRAVQHLVSSSVEGLEPARVSIVDERGKLLASGRGSDDEKIIASEADERNSAFEKRIQGKIADIVASIVGNDRARVQVTAELDYNRIIQKSDIYDPDGQVVRSTQSRTESSSSSQPGGNDAVTVGNELPSADAGQGEGSKSTDDAQKSEEIVNYEISRTTRTETIEAGAIKRISVAVLLDGIYSEGADGKLAYAKRPQAQLDEIAKLVRSAIGYDEKRGDVVQVTNLRFVGAPTIESLDAEEGSMFDLSKGDYFHIAELTVLLLVSVLVLLLVVRPLVRRILAGEPSAAIDLEMELAKAQQEAIAGPASDDPPALPGPEGEGARQATSQTADMIRQATAVGEIQAATVKEIGEIVDNNVNETVSIVRQWIDEEALAPQNRAA